MATRPAEARIRSLRRLWNWDEVARPVPPPISGLDEICDLCKIPRPNIGTGNPAVTSQPPRTAPARHHARGTCADRLSKGVHSP